ncbi:MAG: coniferyl aldehyde dehydrogenase [Pseudomonadota bacterium]
MALAEALPTIDKDRREEDLEELLEVQRAAFAADPMPSASVRRDRLKRLNNALLDYEDRLIKAVDADFGTRAETETRLAEIFPLLEGIRYHSKRVGRWMKPARRHTPLTLQPAKVRVHYQPLGVVGIVSPWNFPIMLGLSPLIGALTAGNRAMIKMSEFAPHTADVVAEMIATTYAPEEVTVVRGGKDIAEAFTKLAFDHLVFTGSTEVGRIVMKAAADNLTPVTLELGGKSPAIIHADFPLDEAARRIAFGKGINAGQICIAPDYVLCPTSLVANFVSAFHNVIAEGYPQMRDNPQYTSIITDAQHRRLSDALDDASEKGATLKVVNPADETFTGTRKMPMTIVTDVTDDMTIMQEEIFGPILPIVPYDTMEDAIAYVNARARPLALYYFDWDSARGARVIRETRAGGTCLNDTLSHVIADDIPFGGIGASGVGHYHGHEGFLRFSHARGVVERGKIHPTVKLGPPWSGPLFDTMMRIQRWRLGRM